MKEKCLLSLLGVACSSAAWYLGCIDCAAIIVMGLFVITAMLGEKSSED